MQIHNNTLITECSAYDFKEMLERKKVKSWLKSVSAFANTDGGSLFYGVNDDGVIVGLENPQADADFISEMIKARLDPVPEVQLIPIEHEEHTLLEVKVKTGTLTPYYYYQDGTRTAYVRVGNESVECNSQQLLSLVLKGTHMTWDSLPTQVDASKHSFIILANTFREQTHQEWNDKYLESFGLVTPDGKLTNAGLLFVDNCTVFQSRIFCTRWTGLYKDDAISSVEHRANLVLLLKYGMDFIKNYTMSGWVKMPNYRLNLPDYSDRAIFEGLVNHLIHRDYTMMGGEVHIDIYDDRVELVSPGAMLDGTQIQDRDIYKVPSMRRNPVIADMFTQLEDFNKPKIVYPNMTKYMPFVYDDNAYCTNQKCFIITGQAIAYLTAFFNSSLFKFCFRDSFPELQGGTREMSKIFFDKIPVMQVTDEMNARFRSAVNDIQNVYSKSKAMAIDSMIFDLYNLSEKERQVIGFVEIE